jgi:integrase
LLDARSSSAIAASIDSGKEAWKFRDQQTRRVLDECPERVLTEKTRTAYRRDYERLKAAGTTPAQAATTRAHFDRLRTAVRYSAAEDVRAWRKLADAHARAGRLADARNATEEAWKLATFLDGEFLQPDRPSWAKKRAEIRAAGGRVTSKSKRRTKVPPPELAGLLLVGRQERVQNRHADRLAVLALTGCRPAELQAGVRLSVKRTEKGTPYLCARIQGAKHDDTRGHEVREVRILAKAGLAKIFADRCGDSSIDVETTPADYRSLNRVLAAAGGGVSCYSFRHAMGGELKAAIADGSISAKEAAAAMGHRSTVSLSYYGTRRGANGGRVIRAAATQQEEIKQKPVSRSERNDARTTRKAAHKARIDRLKASGPMPNPNAPGKVRPAVAPSRPRGPSGPGRSR